jgi:hypothetical protein
MTGSMNVRLLQPELPAEWLNTGRTTKFSNSGAATVGFSFTLTHDKTQENLSVSRLIISRGLQATGRVSHFPLSRQHQIVKHYEQPREN